MNEWSPTDVVGKAFEKVKTDPVGLILPVFLMFLIQAIPNGIFSGIGSALRGADNGEGGPLLLAASGVDLFSTVVSLCVSSFLMAGLFSLLIKAGRGQPYQLGDLFGGGRYFLNMLLGQFLLGLVVSIGFMLCVVPGVIAALGLSLTVPLIIDRDMSAIDAMKESWRLTTGHKVNIFVYALLAFLVALAGAALCCVGYFPAMAIVYLGQIIIYLKLTGTEGNMTAAPMGPGGGPPMPHQQPPATF